MTTPPISAEVRAALDDALPLVWPALAGLAHSPSRRYLPLPYDIPPTALRGNARPAHWAAIHADAAQVRRDVTYLARVVGLTSCDHVTVGLIWAPGDTRRRDEDNLVPLLKACCDALSRGRDDWTGLALVPDDTPAHMTKLMPVILPPPPRGLWLLIDPIRPERATQ